LVTERLIVASLDGVGRDPVCKRTHMGKIFPGFADMIIAPLGRPPNQRDAAMDKPGVQGEL
jgi:hypothetical protein